MHIFIDESGSFAIGAPNHSLSLVGALIVPEQNIKRLLAKYSKLRNGLRKHKGEVKGKLLGEREVARVVDLVRKNSCVFEAVAVDMGVETLDGLLDHRNNQAKELTRNLTSEHHPNLVAGVKELRARLERMPLPLYVQSQATIQLLGNVIEVLPAYWALRDVRETLNYHWVIDGKEVGRVTNAEDWWSTTMLGLMQTRSYRRPMVTPDWVDTSEFQKKFRIAMPDYLREHMPGVEHGVDLSLMMKESFRFSSDAEPGLELVDVVTNATRRALMGNLARSGWSGIPRLMIHSKRSQYVKLVSLTKSDTSRRPYAKLLATEFWHNGRSMLPPSHWTDHARAKDP